MTAPRRAGVTSTFGGTRLLLEAGDPAPLPQLPARAHRGGALGRDWKCVAVAISGT